MRAYSPPKFRVSSISGSRDSRGGRICPPPPGRVILRPSPGDVLRAKLEVPTQICTPNVISKVTPMGTRVAEEAAGARMESDSKIVKQVEQ